MKPDKTGWIDTTGGFSPIGEAEIQGTGDLITGMGDG